MRMRMILIAIVVVVAACSGGGKAKDNTGSGSGSGGTTAFSKDTYHCTPAAGTDGNQAAADCKAKGCDYTQQLICQGIQPPPDVEEAQRKSREDGSIACACVCQSDREACSMVP